MPTHTFIVVCILIIAGCDRRPDAPPKPTAAAIDVMPTTSPTSPTSQPSLVDASIPAPTSAFMLIDQKRVNFPAAKLRLSDEGAEKVVARLFSDDPKDAISDAYAGNSFYFEMDLDCPSPQEIGQARWDFRASTNDRDDTPFGIFLEGHRRQLQPLEVKIDFDPLGVDGKLTTVWISGRFLSINLQDADVPTRIVTVTAHLVANTSVKK